MARQVRRKNDTFISTQYRMADAPKNTTRRKGTVANAVGKRRAAAKAATVVPPPPPPTPATGSITPPFSPHIKIYNKRLDEEYWNI
jgi:hypothetical protein